MTYWGYSEFSNIPDDLVDAIFRFGKNGRDIEWTVKKVREVLPKYSEKQVRDAWSIIFSM